MLLCNFYKNELKFREVTYQDYLKSEIDKEVDSLIIRDIPRTMAKENLFQEPVTSGKNQLYNVLRAYANFDKEVGYC